VADRLDRPEQVVLAPELAIGCLVTGVWRLADMERGGCTVNQDRAAAGLSAYALDSIDSFDMADHRGSDEVIAGRHLKRPACRDRGRSDLRRD